MANNTDGVARESMQKGVESEAEIGLKPERHYRKPSFGFTPPRGRALDNGDDGESSSRSGSVRKRRDSEASIGSKRSQGKR